MHCLLRKIQSITSLFGSEGLPTVGGDYTPPVGRYFLQEGESRSCLNVVIFRDDFFELTEDFSGELRDPLISGVLIDPGTTRIEIEDDDSK